MFGRSIGMIKDDVWLRMLMFVDGLILMVESAEDLRMTEKHFYRVGMRSMIRLMRGKDGTMCNLES